MCRSCGGPWIGGSAVTAIDGFDGRLGATVGGRMRTTKILLVTSQK
jgi:hypothetical protein